jgi:hypothetical protein
VFDPDVILEALQDVIVTSCEQIKKDIDLDSDEDIYRLEESRKTLMTGVDALSDFVDVLDVLQTMNENEEDEEPDHGGIAPA